MTTTREFRCEICGIVDSYLGPLPRQSAAGRDAVLFNKAVRGSTCVLILRVNRHSESDSGIAKSQRRNSHQLDRRTGPDVARGILCTDIGQWSILHFHLASNLLEGASARRENVPPCAAQ
jgi:hypothetical protein